MTTGHVAAGDAALDERVCEITKLLLACGVFRRFPTQRKAAATGFVADGYTALDLKRLAADANIPGAKDPAALLATWLKDEDGELRRRIVDLREEFRANTVNTTRQEQLATLDQPNRRLLAMRGVAALVGDGWTLLGAVREMTKEFKLTVPIEVDEADQEEVVQRARREPSDKAREAIQRMVTRAREVCANHEPQ